MPPSPECPGAQRPAGPQGRIRRRSVPRIRVAAGPALAAAGSIAQMVCSVDIGKSTLFSTARIGDFGKVRVKSRADA